MTLDEQIKEAEQKLADLKAEKERLKNDVNIADCWPTLGDVYIDIYGDLKSHWSLAEVFKPLDICFSDEAQRQRAIRWHKIDKLWKHLAAIDRASKQYRESNSYSFKVSHERNGCFVETVAANGYLPTTYEFKTTDGVMAALKRISQDNLLFWFRGWE